MAEQSEIATKLIETNGAQLFCQKRGSGPALLFVPGIGGDGGPLEMVAKKLADKYTVITYDWRSHSRSTPIPEWHKTSMAELADDTAGLLEKLGCKPAFVYGSGVGGLIVMEMLLRHPKVIKKAIIHDPTIYTVLENGPYNDVPRGAGDLLRSTFFTNGPEAALNLFMRWEYGPEALSAVPGMTFSRIISNAQAFVMTDFPAFAFYKPDEAKLAEIKTPTLVLASTSTPPWRRVMCNWVGEHIHAEVASFLGGHAPYFDHPLEMAEALRECL